MRYFVVGTDSEVGKTVVSAVIIQALTANYWKPIQLGNLKYSDSHKIIDLVSKKIMIYPESYRLTQALPPIQSAKLDGKEIKLKNIIPPTSTHLIIESVGGVMEPIDEKGTFETDIIPFCDAEIILVTKNYKGNINHTLLSIQYLQSKNYPIKGIVITGDKNKEFESFITKNTGVPILFYIPLTDNLSKSFIKEQAMKIRTLIQ